MTRRARAYLAIGGTRHLLLGLFTLRFSEQYQAAVFIPIVGAFPLWFWAALMLAAAFLMGLAAWFRSASIARAGLVTSGTITLAIGVGVAAGVVIVWMHGGAAVPISAVLLLSLACKDFAVCTQPIRSPFEPLWRRIPQPPKRRPL